GPVGALLSMPITVLVVLVLQHNEKTQWVAALLTRERSPEPAAEPAPGPSNAPPAALPSDQPGGSPEEADPMTGPAIDPPSPVPPRRVIVLLLFLAAVFWFARPVMLPFI